MNSAKPEGYSRTQIALHWAVVFLVAVQFLANGGMEDAWRDYVRGEAIEAGDLWLANFHAAVGMTIFVLALWRVLLRLTRGAPPPAADEPRPLRWLASITHFLIYALIIGMPVSGSLAWLFGVEPAGGAHATASNLLLALVGLHVLGAFANLVLFGGVVMRRMLRPQP